MRASSIVNWFVARHAIIGAQDCSSHSGRRRLSLTLRGQRIAPAQRCETSSFWLGAAQLRRRNAVSMDEGQSYA